VRVVEVRVGPDAVEATVTFADGEPLRTSDVPEAVPRLLRILPGLRGHRCDNDAGLAFADEMRDTELAHLLEHAALEIMAMAGSPATLRGSTSWDFARDGRGVFHVGIAYDDDLVAIGAVKAAEAAVRWAASSEGVPYDAEAEARRLQALRSRR
jgi:hypothetical protein